MTVSKDVPLVQRQLARELTLLRTVAGIDQREVAERIGVSQSTISRAERGEKLLPLPKVKAWAALCGADQDVIARLTALTQATFTQVERWQDLLPQTELQDAVRVNEATARTLLNYSPTVVPGLLQTPAYAERVLQLTDYTGQMDIAAALAGRWRRQEALADRSRRFGFLIPEYVLWCSLVDSAIMPAQLDRVANVAAQENVTVGVIRAGTEVVLPLHGFVIYTDRGEDDPFVVIELAHTYVTENASADVTLYLNLYERMAAEAVTGEDVAELIRGQHG